MAIVANTPTINRTARTPPESIRTTSFSPHTLSDQDWQGKGSRSPPRDSVGAGPDHRRRDVNAADTGYVSDGAS